MRVNETYILTGFAMLTASAMTVQGQDYTIDWWTIDYGGIMWAGSEAYELGGSIGQHDAGSAIPMIGGILELTGGYWSPFSPGGEPTIPTVSEWGLIVMSLLVLTAGTLVYTRRQAMPQTPASS